MGLDDLRKLPEGHTITTQDDDRVKAEVTKTSEDTATIIHKHPESGQPVLVSQLDLYGKGLTIDPNSINPSFWTLQVDGEQQPIEKFEEAANNTDQGVEVDPDSRTIFL